MVKRNHKAGQNPPRVVASPEEEEEEEEEEEDSLHLFTLQYECCYLYK
jgi:ribosomal protein L12E/L44/L45/RPP1/RPP2